MKATKNAKVQEVRAMTNSVRLAAMVLALVGASCARQPDVEKVPVGSDVQLTRQDGALVEGKLAARDEKTVKVDVGSVTREVPRDQIADVRVVDRSATKPVEVPAIAKFREYIVPEGTKLSLELDSAVSSETSRVEDLVEARLESPVSVNGVEVLPAGAQLRGEVTAVEPAGKVKGRASLAMKFTRLTSGGETYRIDAPFAMMAPSSKKEDAQKIGFPAAGGAIIGAIIGGKKGAAVGAAVGGGAGTAAVLMTAGKNVALGKGTHIAVLLAEPIEVKVPIR